MVSFHDVIDRGVCVLHLNTEPSYVTRCLVEGLERLHAPVSVTDPSGSMSFGPPDLRPHRAALLVIDMPQARAIDNFEEAMGQIERIKHPAEVILSMSDFNSRYYFGHVPAFATHENALLQIDGTRFPWAFGLSKDILERTAEMPDFSSRQPAILRNFRATYNQSVRNALDLVFVPHLERAFAVDRTIGETAGYHHDRFFRRLETALGCLAYGGMFQENLFATPSIQKSLDPTYESHFRYLREPVISRWDSWRFWESLATGCLTLQLDMDKYGFRLPVMPEPWKHYIPIDLEAPKACVERLTDRSTDLAQIAAAGRVWARTHYEPEACARRFLEQVQVVGAAPN